MILTTITYDEGWQVYVDGERTEIYRALDALVAFDIPDEGEHTVELKYMPSAFSLGIKLSVAGLTVFVAIIIVDTVLKKTILKNRRKKAIDTPWVLEDFDEDYEQYLALPDESETVKPTLIEKASNIFKKLKKNKTDTDNKDYKKDNGDN